MNLLAMVVSFVLISWTLLLKKLKLDFTFSISSSKSVVAFITFNVRMRMFPLDESFTRLSMTSRNFTAYSKFILDMNLFIRKHFASRRPFVLVNALTRREIIFSC